MVPRRIPAQPPCPTSALSASYKSHSIRAIPRGFQTSKFMSVCAKINSSCNAIYMVAKYVLLCYYAALAEERYCKALFLLLSTLGNKPKCCHQLHNDKRSYKVVSLV